MEKSTIIVFALEHYNPLGVIRNLGECGISPVYIAVKHHAPIASRSKYISQLYSVNSVEEGYELLLQKYGEEYKTGKKPFVLFSDDKSVSFFDSKREELEQRFIYFNAREKGRIAYYMNKNNILQLAKKHGLQILDTVVVKCGEIPQNIQYPIITKSISPTSGGWKSDVFICNTEKELVEAFTKIQSEEVIIQKYIEKENEMTYEGYSINQGKESVIAIQCKYNYLLKGYYSPNHSVESPQDNYIVQAVKNMIKEVEFEGLFEVEFLLDKSGNIFFSEINFRNSPWSYSATKAGIFLPYLWCKSMLLKRIENVQEVKKPYNAMVEPIDFAKRVDSGMITFAQWLREFKEIECTYYYNSLDIEPFNVLQEHWDDFK